MTETRGYERLRARGLHRHSPAADRFMAYVEKTEDGCWIEEQDEAAAREEAE